MQRRILVQTVPLGNEENKNAKGETYNDDNDEYSTSRALAALKYTMPTFDARKTILKHRKTSLKHRKTTLKHRKNNFDSIKWKFN